MKKQHSTYYNALSQRYIKSEELCLSRPASPEAERRHARMNPDDDPEEVDAGERELEDDQDDHEDDEEEEVENRRRPRRSKQMYYWAATNQVSVKLSSVEFRLHL